MHSAVWTCGRPPPRHVPTAHGACRTNTLPTCCCTITERNAQAGAAAAWVLRISCECCQSRTTREMRAPSECEACASELRWYRSVLCTYSIGRLEDMCLRGAYTAGSTTASSGCSRARSHTPAARHVLCTRFKVTVASKVTIPHSNGRRHRDTAREGADAAAAAVAACRGCDRSCESLRVAAASRSCDRRCEKPLSAPAVARAKPPAESQLRPRPATAGAVAAATQSGGATQT